MKTENSKTLIEFFSDVQVSENTAEVFAVKHGVGHFNPDTHSHLIMSNEVIWLPAAAESLRQKVMEDGENCVSLVGTTGAGKSALVYGLRVLFRQLQQEYYYIDAHYQTTDSKIIGSILDDAIESGAPVFYDSSDYLIARNKYKSKGWEKHLTRSDQILTKLIDFTSNGGRLISTRHHELWLEAYTDINTDFKDPELPFRESREKLIDKWKNFTANCFDYEVDIHFTESAGLVEFFINSGLDKESAKFLGETIFSSDFMNYFLFERDQRNIFFYDDGTEGYVDVLTDRYTQWERLTDVATKYAISKIISKDNYDENQELLELVQRYVQHGDDEPDKELLKKEVWETYIQFIQMKDYLLQFFHF